MLRTIYNETVTGVDLPWVADCAIRAADEGVPIGAIKRIFKPDYDFLREVLHDAVDEGRLIQLPAEDWPPRGSSTSREPTTSIHDLGGDDQELFVRMARTIHTTQLESRVLLAILRRGHAHREQIYASVQKGHVNPDDAPEMKIIDVVVCKLRKKLKPMGVNIRTLHAVGYELTDLDRNKLWALIRE